MRGELWGGWARGGVDGRMGWLCVSDHYNCTFVILLHKEKKPNRNHKKRNHTIYFPCWPVGVWRLCSPHCIGCQPYFVWNVFLLYFVILCVLEKGPENREDGELLPGAGGDSTAGPCWESAVLQGTHKPTQTQTKTQTQTCTNTHTAKHTQPSTQTQTQTSTHTHTHTQTSTHRHRHTHKLKHS